MAGGSYVGVDIGSNLIKVAEVRRSSTGVEVTALGMAPTPQQAYDNGTIVDPQMLGQAVKTLLKQSGIGTSQSVSSVAGPSSVVVRVIDVPQMNPAELAETMKWEVERQVPFPVDQLVMDYQPIERPEGVSPGQNMEVLLAVAQQDMIDRHVDMLFAAGLKPKAIDVEPLAVGRALLDLAPPSQVGHTVAIVNVGASNTDIGIFRDRLLAFPRTVPLAGDSLTRAISESLQVDLATAEQYKRDLGEVIFGQQAQQANPFDVGLSGGDPGGGFFNFGEPEAAAPPPASSPSGRMPFDFSMQNEDPGAPPPLSGVTPAPSPFDFNSASAPSSTGEPTPFEGGEASNSPFGLAPDPISAEPHGATAYGAPDAPLDNPFAPVPDNSFASTPPPVAPQAPMGQTTGQNLVPTDPAREALKINIFNAIAPVLAELVQEVRRSLDYYRTKTGDAPIHEIVLVGGTAKLRNLADFLTQETGIPTRVATFGPTVSVTSKNFSQGHLDDIISLFPVSIGLASRDLVATSGGTTSKKKKK